MGRPLPASSDQIVAYVIAYCANKAFLLAPIEF
jgi:hypothetical protein